MLIDQSGLRPERKQMHIAFSAACTNYLPWVTQDSDSKTQQVMLLERGCYNATIVHCGENNQSVAWANPFFLNHYSSLCAKILANIDPCSSVGSTYLADWVIDGNNPALMANMSAVELCPAASKLECDEILARSSLDAGKPISKLHKCKCGSRSIDVEEHQTRSADELPTLTARCKDCYRVWRLH